MSACWLRQTGLAWLRMAGINTGPVVFCHARFLFDRWWWLKIICLLYTTRSVRASHHLRARTVTPPFTIYSFCSIISLFSLSPCSLLLHPWSDLLFIYCILPFSYAHPINPRIHKTHPFDPSLFFFSSLKKSNPLSTSLSCVIEPALTLLSNYHHLQSHTHTWYLHIHLHLDNP